MSITINIEPYALNRSPNFLRLIERIQQCFRDRERQRRKTYSIFDYIEHLKRSINENPLIARALFRFYKTIRNFPSQNNHFTSTIVFENDPSKMSFEEKISIDHLYRMNEDSGSKSDLSKISLTTSQSTTHSMQLSGVSRQINGLMTKATLSAIHKAPHQRTTSDIEVLEHLLNRCESLRHLPVQVRHYAARSLFLLTYLPNTILTRQNSPLFLVYIIVHGQCHLLLETNETTLFGQQLTVGDVYGDDSLHRIIDHRLNGLITSDNTHCSLIAFFSRDIRAYENYFSDMMKQSLLEQLRSQSSFLAMQWRSDILDYFRKWAMYKQYSIDQIVYGNEQDEHKNLHFILQGQVSFVCLLEFPSIAIKYPAFYQKITKGKSRPIKTPIIDLEKHSNSRRNVRPQMPSPLNPKTTWRILEIFLLSNGHYFGFEPTTHHSWYLTRTTVDIISIPKTRFKQLGSFAPMILDKLRQDLLDIFPTEHFIRQSYIKHLQMNQSNANELFTMKFTPSVTTKHEHHRLEKINWIPAITVLNQYKANLSKPN